MEKKQSSFSLKRLVKKSGGAWKYWWKFGASGTGGLRFRRLSFQLWFVDGVLFKIVSVLEGIVLIASLCFFYLLCGCHF